MLIPQDDSWSIDYDVYQHGPHTVYTGTARLNADEDNLFPCLNYTFQLPDGELGGPSISSNPRKPMLPFDWELTNNELNISWCRTSLPLHPFTGEDLQCCYPIEIPRHFIFYVTKTEFNGEDLAKLLADWGPPRELEWPENGTVVSPWDLNGDTYVDGGDLTILLGKWKTS
jgi:hypothetical protein